jgi:hypothetical protein
MVGGDSARLGVQRLGGQVASSKSSAALLRPRGATLRAAAAPSASVGGRSTGRPTSDDGGRLCRGDLSQRAVGRVVGPNWVHKLSPRRYPSGMSVLQNLRFCRDFAARDETLRTHATARSALVMMGSGVRVPPSALVKAPQSGAFLLAGARCTAASANIFANIDVGGHPQRGTVTGTRPQAVTNEHQIVIAAEVMTAAPDFGHLEPMLDAAQRELQAAGVSDRPEVLLADAGYWHQQQMEHIIDRGIQVLIPAGRQQAQGRAPRLGGRLLRVHAPGPRRRARRRALPPTPAHDRAGLRPDEVQPRHRSLPTTRACGRPVGMAPDHGHAQPAQAPPKRPRGRLRNRQEAPGAASRSQPSGFPQIDAANSGSPDLRDSLA